MRKVHELAEFHDEALDLGVMDAMKCERLACELIFAGIEALKEFRDEYAQHAIGTNQIIKKAERELKEATIEKDRPVAREAREFEELAKRDRWREASETGTVLEFGKGRVPEDG